MPARTVCRHSTVLGSIVVRSRIHTLMISRKLRVAYPMGLEFIQGPIRPFARKKLKVFGDAIACFVEFR
jgi:hypothetical protein